MSLVPGPYLIVATTDDPNFAFHEVLRYVPTADEMRGISNNQFPHLSWKLSAGDICELASIRLPPAIVIREMESFKGDSAFSIIGDFSADPQSREVTVEVQPFLLDRTEVLVGDVYRVWPDSRQAPPYMLSQMSQQPPPEDFPVGAASWHEAVAFAESIGKRLPTDAEYEFAVTAGGTQKLPWGDDIERITEWTFGPVGTPEWDRLSTNADIGGLYSNVAEWTMSWPRGSLLAGVRRSDFRIVAGGNTSIIAAKPTRENWSLGPRIRAIAPTNSWNPGLGFRCVRSVRPRSIQSTSHQLR
jgi:hypothetical protein